MTAPTPNSALVDRLLAEICQTIVRDAIPATESGATCFVPKYQVDALRVALEREATALASPQEGWLPIESAPKDGARVLLHYASRRLTKVGRWDAAYNYWSADQFFHERPPTHWHPLPASPITPSPSQPAEKGGGE